jgi:hypothetical protein
VKVLARRSGAVGLVRLAAAANHSSEVERMRELSAFDIRSVPVSAGLYQFARLTDPTSEVVVNVLGFDTYHHVAWFTRLKGRVGNKYSQIIVFPGVFPSVAIVIRHGSCPSRPGRTDGLAEPMAEPMGCPKAEFLG